MLTTLFNWVSSLSIVELAVVVVGMFVVLGVLIQLDLIATEG
jgi:hypothetical protein